MRTARFWKKVGLVAGLMLSFAASGRAQGGTSGSSSSGSGSASSAIKDIGKDKSPTNMENSLELIKPVDRREETDFRDFRSAPADNPARKIALGEAFLQKYPTSRYRPTVYSGLTGAYLTTNQLQKMEESGEKALALNPKDVQVLAMFGQTIPRTITSSTPDQIERLDKAEQYSRRAIEATPAIAKPEDMTDEEFAAAKNQILAIAHSGLGLVNFRRGNYAGAVAELEQSVKLNPTGDAVNYYVLGAAQQNTSHFAEAAAAFSKCAEFKGSLQATCKDNADKVQARAAASADKPK